MAVHATRRPMLQSSPARGAHAAVAATDTSIPRTVFDAPNSGCPSMNPPPPSNGKERRRPRMSLAITGAPFATVNRNNIRAMVTGFIVVLYLKSRIIVLPAVGLPEWSRKN